MNLRKSTLSMLAPCALALLSACSSAPIEPETGIPKTPVIDASDPSQGQEVITARVPESEFSDPDGYVLGQGDVIGIQVFDEPDLTLDATVSSSGIINYSYLGDVRVSGKTPLELERDIATLLGDGFLINPSVNVTVIEFRPFFISGEVRSPGSYPYQPGLTLDKAIALAGGLTDRASSRRMFVVKAGGDTNNPRRISLSSPVSPGDTISIREGFF